MRELSVFCDESGDFGPVSPHAPFYIVGFVLHEQDDSLGTHIDRFEQNVSACGLSGFLPVHMMPLIRRERPYASLEGASRKKLFDLLFAFFRRSPVTWWAVCVDKRRHGEGLALQRRLAHELGAFLREHADYFHSFDRVVVYYDWGQKEVGHVLQLVFLAALANVEFRKVRPQDYLLFQCTDLVCGMNLVELRREGSGLSKSESAFFGGAGRFTKTYLKAFNRKRFSGK